MRVNCIEASVRRRGRSTPPPTAPGFCMLAEPPTARAYQAKHPGTKTHPTHRESPGTRRLSPGLQDTPGLCDGSTLKYAENCKEKDGKQGINQLRKQTAHS